MLANHPERVLAVAEPALRVAPDTVLPLLLDRMRHAGAAGISGSDNTLEILTQWATAVLPRDRDSIRRRSILLDATLNWWHGRRDAPTALRTACIALSPGFHFLAPDPGSRRRGAIVQGHLGDEDLTTLTGFWPRVTEVVRNSTDVPWDSLFRLLRAWRYLHPSSLADIEIEASTRAITRSFAERMLRDLAALSHDKPGVQTALREMSTRFGVRIEAPRDEDFEDLYPPGFMSAPAGELDQRVIDRWRCRSVDRIALSLARVQIEASHAGLRYPPWAALWLCARLAETLPDSVAAATALMKRELPGELVAPFLHQVAKDSRSEWASMVHRCLRSACYREIGFAAAICHPAPPRDVLSAALGDAGDMATIIESCFYQRSIPAATTRTLLECGDSRVAVPAAIGHWRAVKRDAHGALDETWRRAILRAPVGETGGSGHDDYWIGEVMSADPLLAEEWLTLKFGPRGDLHFWTVEDAVTRIVTTMGAEGRTKVLLGLRPDPWNEALVRLLVGDDHEMYGRLLDVRNLARLHLAPLTGKPDGHGWRAKALQALDRGRVPGEIAEATLGMSHEWAGSESRMWTAWRRSFEALLDDSDHRIVRIGKQGAETTKKYESQALERERASAVHGW